MDKRISVGKAIVMSLAMHVRLAIYSFITWLTFYLIGLPDYYQSWPLWSKIVICIAVTLAYFPITAASLRKFWHDGQHLKNSCWLALYLTLPFFIYDYLLLGLYLGLGIELVIPYWYLTLFYFSFWVQFPLVAYWLIRAEKTNAT